LGTLRSFVKWVEWLNLFCSSTQRGTSLVASCVGERLISAWNITASVCLGFF
jgi:hypothetical protein